MFIAHTRSAAAAVVMLSATLCVSQPVAAQSAQTITAGASIPVRTSEAIDASAVDGRVFTGVVDQDVLDANGRVAIPTGSSAELMVKKTTNNDLTLDLESLTVNGERYAISADPNAVGTSGVTGTVKNGASTIGANQTTAMYIGGGALLGTIVGAIAGGGKGAAIGAAVGAAAGAGTQIVTQGKKVDVPAESLLTFRLGQALTLGVQDSGFTRNGFHYHRY